MDDILTPWSRDVTCVLRFARLVAAVELLDVADAAKVSASRLRRFERGQAFLSSEEIYRVARMLRRALARRAAALTGLRSRSRARARKTIRMKP